jgi:hypothetical protein
VCGPRAQDLPVGCKAIGEHPHQYSQFRRWTAAKPLNSHARLRVVHTT